MSKYLLTVLLLVAGTMHFVHPRFYATIVPPYLPWRWELAFANGICEIALGMLLLIPKFSRTAAWGIIALLVAVFPANIYLYQHQELLPAPAMLHFLRLPLQAVFLIWAYWHTKP
jgi:uncharacterized membrane protein